MLKEGERIEIAHLAEGDPVAEVGDRGTVDFINHNDDVGRQVFVKLDKGGNIGLLEEDGFKVITEGREGE